MQSMAVFLSLIYTLRIIESSTYSSWGSNDTFSCPSAGSDDVCNLYCDPDSNGKQFHCGNAGECYFYCQDNECMRDGILNGTNSDNLYVYSSHHQCMKNNEVYVPNNGNATFSINKIDQKELREMIIYGGSNTYSIRINCTGSTIETCLSIEVYAENTQYLEIIGHAGSIMTNAMINCPQNSNYNGIPCIIDFSGGGIIKSGVFNTLNGIPKDIVITGTLTGKTTITCSAVDASFKTENVDNSFNNNGDCWITYSPTTDPTNIPTNTPTINPTLNPTISPSLNPTIPTINPTNIPTYFPSTNPTIDPTLNPTTNPTLPEGKTNNNDDTTTTVIISDDDDNEKDSNENSKKTGDILVYIIIITCIFVCIASVMMVLLMMKKKKMNKAKLKTINEHKGNIAMEQQINNRNIDIGEIATNVVEGDIDGEGDGNGTYLTTKGHDPANNPHVSNMSMLVDDIQFIDSKPLPSSPFLGDNGDNEQKNNDDARSVNQQYDDDDDAKSVDDKPVSISSLSPTDDDKMYTLQNGESKTLGGDHILEKEDIMDNVDNEDVLQYAFPGNKTTLGGDV